MVVERNALERQPDITFQFQLTNGPLLSKAKRWKSFTFPISAMYDNDGDYDVKIARHISRSWKLKIEN